MSEPITHTLEAPGAKLTYDIRPTDSSHPDAFAVKLREVLADQG